MTELPDLKQLTNEAKGALILALWEALQKLQQKRPQKASKNSSLPPAKGFKAEVKGKANEGEKTRVGSIVRRSGRPICLVPQRPIPLNPGKCVWHTNLEIVRMASMPVMRFSQLG